MTSDYQPLKEMWSRGAPTKGEGSSGPWNFGRYHGSCRGNFDLQAPGFSFCCARCAPKKEPVVPQNVGADSHLFREPPAIPSPSSPLGHGEMFWIRSDWDCICWRVYKKILRGDHIILSMLRKCPKWIIGYFWMDSHGLCCSCLVQHFAYIKL